MRENYGRWEMGDGRWKKMEEDGRRWKKMEEDGRRWKKREERRGKRENGRRKMGFVFSLMLVRQYLCVAYYVYFCIIYWVTHNLMYVTTITDFVSSSYFPFPFFLLFFPSLFFHFFLIFFIIPYVLLAL
jgi:hypothetical protein